MVSLPHSTRPTSPYESHILALLQILQPIDILQETMRLASEKVLQVEVARKFELTRASEALRVIEANPYGQIGRILLFNEGAPSNPV